MSSQLVKAMARYSASAEERETVVCFFDFHEINESPRKMQKPVTDLLVSAQPAQSQSVKAFKMKRAGSREEVTLTRSAFEIAKDSMGCIKVKLVGFGRKLTKDLKCIRKVWPGNGQIQKASYQLAVDSGSERGESTSRTNFKFCSTGV